MTRHSRQIAVLAIIAAGILPAAATSAQPAPLYPYAVQQDRPYAVQVAPNTYVIQRPAQTRNYPYVRCENCGRSANIRATGPAPKRFDRPHKQVDRALVEELRARSKHKVKERDEAKEGTKEKETNINSIKIVRNAPVVEHKRDVDNPPRVIERKIVADEPAGAKCKHGLKQNCDNGSRTSGDSGKKRIINADAEITILGPDRMSIRLFRKGHGPSAKASDNE